MKDGENGKALMSGRVKLHGFMSDWGEYVKPARQKKDKDMIIVTYSLPKIESYFAQSIIKDRTGKTVLIYNSKFNDRYALQYFHDEGVKLIPMEDVHAKMALISPDSVTIGSENFVFSNWFETAVTIKNSDAYDFELNNICEYLGYNPLSGENIKSCRSCWLFDRVWNPEEERFFEKCRIRCEQTEQGCSNYKPKKRIEFESFRRNLDRYWFHSCRNCRHITYANGATYNGYICPIMSKFFPMIRKNASDPDMNIPCECQYWEKGLTHSQVV